MFGGVPLPFSYMHAEDHNPYVTAWFIGMLILAVAFTLWVLLADGASRMRELQRLGAFGRANQLVEMPEWLIKLLALLVPAFVLLFIYAAGQAGTRIPG